MHIYEHQLEKMNQIDRSRSGGRHSYESGCGPSYDPADLKQIGFVSLNDVSSKASLKLAAHPQAK